MIAIVGAGRFGEALLSGLLRAGHRPSEILACVESPERGVELRQMYGIEVVSIGEAARGANELLLDAKPEDMSALLRTLGQHLTSGDQLVISIAPGIRTRSIEAHLGDGLAVVRVTSNSPILIDEAMFVMSAGTHATEKHLLRAEELLRPVGRVLRIPERQHEVATALSGSGPAYFYYLVEAMVDAGVVLGVLPDAALQMVVQSALGAALMLRDSGEQPVQLRRVDTLPGGVTASAIRELDTHSVHAAVMAAIEAARNRGRELAEGFDRESAEDASHVLGPGSLGGARVFISYAHEDVEQVSDIYRYLKTVGCVPWMDRFNLLPGQDWEAEIKRALEASDFVLICLSPASVNKRGYVQKEVNTALQLLSEIPENQIFLIPARLKECQVPDSLKRKHHVDLFLDDGLQRVALAIQAALTSGAALYVEGN
jgi:pyrroline-5-carboxylate reductase